MNWSYYYVTQSGGYSQWGNSYGYDWQGNLKSGSVGGSNPYNFNYTYNTDNQITRRDQSYGSNQTNMHEVHYYFNGMAIGDISNNGSSNVDYAQSLANHRAVQGSGPFQNGATSGTTYANFDQSYDAINGQDYQSTSSLYTVQAGDTLQSIAYLSLPKIPFAARFCDSDDAARLKFFLKRWCLAFRQVVNAANLYRAQDVCGHRCSI